MTELSDELLVAYVDGQLARKQTRAVDMERWSRLSAQSFRVDKWSVCRG